MGAGQLVQWSEESMTTKQMSEADAELSEWHRLATELLRAERARQRAPAASIAEYSRWSRADNAVRVFCTPDRLARLVLAARQAALSSGGAA